VEKSSPQIWATSEIFRQLPKVNYRPKGEKSPNLVTLFGSINRSYSLAWHQHRMKSAFRRQKYVRM
jgi:hypothetical protein